MSELEVLVPGSILAVALLAIATLFPTAVTDVNENEAMGPATALAQQRIEQLKNVPFSILTGLHTTSTPPALPPSGEEAVWQGEKRFTRRTWVQVSGMAPRRQAVVTLILEWAEPTGTEALRLDTLIAERE